MFILLLMGRLDEQEIKIITSSYLYACKIFMTAKTEATAFQDHRIVY